MKCSMWPVGCFLLRSALDASHMHTRLSLGHKCLQSDALWSKIIHPVTVHPAVLLAACIAAALIPAVMRLCKMQMYVMHEEHSVSDRRTLFCQRCCTFSSLSTAQQVSCSLSADEHSWWGHCESWGATRHPTALWTSFPQPQTVWSKCILSPVLLVLTGPCRGIRVVVWGLMGESGVDSDGEAEANRRESVQCGTEGEEEYKERHTDVRELKLSARQKWEWMCGL